jgi:hypothetical protein
MQLEPGHPRHFHVGDRQEVRRKRRDLRTLDWLAIIALVPEVALTEALLRLTSRAPRLFGDFRVIWDNLTGGNRSACELLVPYRMCANPPLVRVGSRRRGPAPGRRRSCREAADRRLLRSRTMAEGLGVFFSNAGPTGRARGIGTAATFNGTPPTGSTG